MDANRSIDAMKAPEIGGPESITLSLEGQATGNPMQSSIVIQRIAY